MKRTRVLRLVLLGGGLVAMTACGESAPPPQVNDQTRRFACEQAKQQNLPNAMELCSQVGTSSSSSTSSSSGRTYHSGGGGWFPWFFGRSYGSSGSAYTGSWFSGRSSSDSGSSSSSSSSSSSRGGFGATASSHGSSSGS
ncbi:hypothetical protein [Falsiroseomonas sp. HW251]|uniref:hypothetical protein n=1 Tax=Falsiroseomonas sp. HW251 TaxID=3390998 RepID=UPI003D3143B9